MRGPSSNTQPHPSSPTPLWLLHAQHPTPPPTPLHYGFYMHSTGVDDGVFVGSSSTHHSADDAPTSHPASAASAPAVAAASLILSPPLDAESALDLRGVAAKDITDRLWEDAEVSAARWVTR